MPENTPHTVLPAEPTGEFQRRVTGSGTESDPLKVYPMPTAQDPVAAAIAKQRQGVTQYEAAFRSGADLSVNLPADVRQMVSQAASAITGTVGKAQDARKRADSFLNDQTMWPDGRRMMAGDAIKAAQDSISESFSEADAKMAIADALLYETSRPRLAQADAMTARADLDMITRSAISANSPGALVNSLKTLASGDDALAALVADETYLTRFLAANGIAQDVAQAIVTNVKAAVVASAAASGDPKRAAAGRTSQALGELRKARAAATSYARNTLNAK
ncbi:hypothetical protein [Actinacidiphila rubida]|uniref:Uncharacterized protein n=1 Tax=Actinacidiphila rubida TaxID=310780 RepID=A0A1H8PLH6_9ACTN|nr:hypothetical protein [Actinacidiphila rubida]SEO42641.1 hypothetical protein SAMN05216267_102628 [Actinacidiphila rubida]